MTGTSTRLAEMKPGRPRTAARETTAAWLAAGVSGILGFAIDGYRAGKVPLWGDEGVTKAMASRGVGQILATMPHDDVVHGAYYLVMHAVIGVAGSGFTALRFPSVIAMAVAAAVTALLARRLAALAGSPAPAVTGLAAGVLFAFLPGVLRYAQEARSYAIVTMLATISTYLLVKALTEGGGTRRWTLYGVATGLTGLFNLFGLFLLAAHAVTVTAARIARRGTGKDGPRRTVAGLPAGWIIASAGAVVVLIPVALLARSEQSALAWLGKPPFAASLRQLALFWAGPARITLFLFGLAAFGAIAGTVASTVAGTAASARQRGPVTPVTVALPWLVLPPVLLLGISQIDPLYSGRYLEYCTPALAIAASWGLTWLARAIGAPLHRFRLGTIRLSWAGWLPAPPSACWRSSC
jgi:mannosyltransferase